MWIKVFFNAITSQVNNKRLSGQLARQIKMCKLSDDQVIMTAVFTYSVHVCIYLQFAMNEKKKAKLRVFFMVLISITSFIQTNMTSKGTS